MANVSLIWYWNTFSVDEDMKSIMKSITEHIVSDGYRPHFLARSVYVIRLTGSFMINYPNEPSPVLYIGKGTFKNRLNSHRSWLQEFFNHLSGAKFEIRYCLPRVKNNLGVETEVEAYLHHRFVERYGMLPINNKQLGKITKTHTFTPAKALDKAISIGRGNKPHWAMVPLRSNAWNSLYSSNLQRHKPTK